MSLQKIFSKLFLVAVAVTLFSFDSTFAQEVSLAEKKSLISKFRILTGANNVRMRINFTVADVQKDLIELVEKDADLTESQKVELKKSAIEGGARLDKEVKDFFADQAKLTPISEEIIFQIYDKTFTESELRELVAFYQTTAGKKVLEFLPTLSAQYQKAYTEAVFPVLQEFIRPKIISETDQLKRKVADEKSKKNKN
jgi:uncharacterized protein